MNTETHATQDRYKDIAAKVDRETAEKLNPFVGSMPKDTLSKVCGGLDLLANLSVLNEATEISFEKWYWYIEAMTCALRHEEDTLPLPVWRKNKEVT